ncbi:MAG: hypothetical protein DRJ50_00595 [Actinobacteria bacterium]|nr:MAG: hypothetical protein DRJ50_00595 [Actinomycetota bacterium]
MEPGPLPPHERTWRHPSELGPTEVEVETGSNARVIALAAGTLAVFIVAAMVIAVTPRRSSAPIALTATTSPVFLSAGPASAPSSPVADNRQSIRLASFSAMPNAITSAPQFSLDGREVTAHLPSPTELILLRTEAVTYQLRWVDVPLLVVPDGSVIVDSSGDLVAHVSRGRLVLLVAD